MARHRHRHRHRPAAALWYDCSMLQDDETVFLLPHDQGRRFFPNDHHLLLQNQRFPHHREDDDQTVIVADRKERIAKHIKSRVHHHAVDHDGVCVVCLDDLAGKIAKLDCGHQYHQRCINNWLNVNNTCPLCKATIVI